MLKEITGANIFILMTFLCVKQLLKQELISKKLKSKLNSLFPLWMFFPLLHTSILLSGLLLEPYQIDL